MTIFLALLAAVSAVFAVLAFVKIKRLQTALHDAQEEPERLRKHYEEETNRIYNETLGAISKATSSLDKYATDLKEESERIRAHYEAEALKIKTGARATLAQLEPFRRYALMADGEGELRRLVSEASTEATQLRAEARKLIEGARLFAAEERSKSVQFGKEMRRRADAILDQATRDAGRMAEEATKRAEQIAGDAYVALRDKQTLEQAVQALWNVTEGYGDRYVVPSRSVLDELASDFGHDQAGEALRSAREQSRRMVEEKQAADCNYVETDRRERANRFVVDAFNGRVDAILSRTKHDNHGLLEQEIRDAFSLVNLNGLAFRDARILPAYLDARLAELKWAGVVQELRRKEREEQKRIQEQMRDEERARRDYERAQREAVREADMLLKAREQARAELETASLAQRAKLEEQIAELNRRVAEAEAKGQRALSMAQQTKLGHVYIISNIGSFGEDVFKIGMTRRLIPQDRIDELSDSSVPFDFDIHALIQCDNAPALEAKLHSHFVLAQINKVNHRKEFFRLDLKFIRDEIEKLGITTHWTLASEAAQFRESLAIEEAIKKSPAAREAWINRQFQLELLEQEAEDAIRDSTNEINSVPIGS